MALSSTHWAIIGVAIVVFVVALSVLIVFLQTDDTTTTTCDDEGGTMCNGICIVCDDATQLVDPTTCTCRDDCSLSPNTIWSDTYQRCIPQCDLDHYVYNPTTGTCDEIVDCGSIEINSDTGEVSGIQSCSNATGTACETCPDDVILEQCQQTTCQVSSFTDPSYDCDLVFGQVGTYPLFDGYDPISQKCTSSLDCELHACTQDYCLNNAEIMSPFYDANSNQIPMITQSDSSCANPTLYDLEIKCESQEGYVWNPDMTGEYGSTPGICQALKTIVSIVADYDSTQSDTSQIVGTLAFAYDPTVIPQLPFQFVFNNTTGTLSTMVAYPGGCSSDMLSKLAAAGFTDTASIYCYSYSIVFGTNPPNADQEYELEFMGMMAIDSAYIGYSMLDDLIITLSPSASGDNVDSSLTPVMDYDYEVELAYDETFTQDSITALSADYTTSFQDPTTITAPFGLASTETSSDYVLTACRPDLCKDFGTTVPFKMAILAWKKITKPSNPCTKLSRDFSTYSVKYSLSRIDALLGESSRLQLIDVTRGNDDPDDYVGDDMSYVDVVDVNTTYTYRLGAFLADSSVYTSYDTSECRSPPYEFTIVVGQYDDAFCRTLGSPLSDMPYPSFMWSENGMCYWSDNQTAASDFQCMFSLGSATKEGTYDPSNLELFSGSQTSGCASIGKSLYPSAISEWSCEYSSAASGCGPIDESACIDGIVDSPRVYQCNDELQVGSANRVLQGCSGFSATIEDVLAFANAHPDLIPGLDVSSISNPYTTCTSDYFDCPLDLDSPPYWGMQSYSCAQDDYECQRAQDVAGLTSVNWFSNDGQWELNDLDSNTYQQDRVRFPDPDVYATSDSACCGSHGTYSVVASSGENYGTCDCDPGYEYDDASMTCISKCANMLCDLHGDAYYDLASDSCKCLCDSGYNNLDITTQPYETVTCPKTSDFVALALGNGVSVTDYVCDATGISQITLTEDGTDDTFICSNIGTTLIDGIQIACDSNGNITSVASTSC